MTFIFYFHYQDLKIHVENDGEEVLTSLSKNVSFQMKLWKSNTSNQILQNVIHSTDFNNKLSEMPENIYISIIEENEEQAPIAVISPQDLKLEINYVNTLADKAMDVYNKSIASHDMQHSSIYRLKEEYYMSSFTPINDENGQLVGIIGMDTKINDQFIFFKKIIIQTGLFILISYLLNFRRVISANKP